MILVTVGMQLPFARLIAIMDELAPTLGEPVFAQIGPSSPRPRNIQWAEMLKQGEFDTCLSTARLVVSHAGIGSILAARKHRKPIILFPRQTRYGEHRNDHQLATCNHITRNQGHYVARDSRGLLDLLRNKDLQPAETMEEPPDRQHLLRRLREHLEALERKRN